MPADYVNTDISEFVDLVTTKCPAPMTFMKERAIRAAARLFCNQVKLWRDEIERVRIYPSDTYIHLSGYVAAISDAAKVVDVDDAWLSDGDKTHLRKYSRQRLDRGGRSWRTETSDAPTGFLMDMAGRFRLYPLLSDDADAGYLELDMEVILSPDPTISKFPDFLFDHYGEIVAAGAAQRLMMQPDAEWNDPKRAAVYALEFEQGITDAKADEAKAIVDAVNRESRRQYRGGSRIRR